MAEVTRAAQSDDDWASTPASAQEDTYDPARGAMAWVSAVFAAGDLNEACRKLERQTPEGARCQIEGGMAHNVVALVAMLQDIRRSLAETEAYLAREIGRDEMAPREGVLPDGRRFVVKRGADRKAWSHDDWKRDVRQQIMSGVRAVVDVDTGEPVELGDLLAAVQDVSSSAPPKVTALKRLGLDPDSYCETYPGPFSVQVSAPGKDDE